MLLASAKLGLHTKDFNDPHLWILMYHRILPKNDTRYHREEPGMVVEPETFRQQLEWLQYHFSLISLEEWLERRTNNLPLPAKSCALTFDDGWEDTFTYAFPIIQQAQVPATVFPVSDIIGTHLQFWPNRLIHLIERADLPTLSSLSWLAPWIPRYRKPNREELAAIIKRLKQNSDHQIESWLDEAEQEIFGSGFYQQQKSLMDWQQLSTMANSPLITIGSHTRHHYRLQDVLPEAVIKDQIVNSKRRLEDALDLNIKLFCYPGGVTSPLAISLVAQHYLGAVTTLRGINTPQEVNHHMLKRISMHQDSSSTELKLQSLLSGWF